MVVVPWWKCRGGSAMVEVVVVMAVVIDSRPNDLHGRLCHGVADSKNLRLLILGLFTWSMAEFVLDASSVFTLSAIIAS